MVTRTKTRTRTSAARRSAPPPAKKLAVRAVHPLDTEPHPLSAETQARDEELSGLLYLASDGTENHPVPEDIADGLYDLASMLADGELVLRGYAGPSGVPVEASDSEFWRAWYVHYLALIGCTSEISGLTPEFIAECLKKAG